MDKLPLQYLDLSKPLPVPTITVTSDPLATFPLQPGLRLEVLLRLVREGSSPQLPPIDLTPEEIVRGLQITWDFLTHPAVLLIGAGCAIGAALSNSQKQQKKRKRHSRN